MKKFIRNSKLLRQLTEERIKRLAGTMISLTRIYNMHITKKREMRETLKRIL